MTGTVNRVNSLRAHRTTYRFDFFTPTRIRNNFNRKREKFCHDDLVLLGNEKIYTPARERPARSSSTCYVHHRRLEQGQLRLELLKNVHSHPNAP